jgi:hypothetical protein
MAILYQNTEEYEKFVRQDFEGIGGGQGFRP